MSDVASRELSEELYKLSGWDTEIGWLQFGKHLGKEERWTIDARDISDFPAYDAGYLLRKLPDEVVDDVDVIRHISLRTRKRTNDKQSLWKAGYGKLYQAKADTPEDALCKLACILFKGGILPISGRD